MSTLILSSDCLLVCGKFNSSNTLKVINVINRSTAETSLLLQPKWGNYSAKGSFDPPSFCWTPSQEGFVKINVDGGFRAPNKASYGIIARDSAGFCHWASCVPLLAESPLMAEALALVEAAVKAVRRSGLSRVFVESDCQNLISHLNSSANLSPSDLFFFFFLKEDLVNLCGAAVLPMVQLKSLQNWVLILFCGLRVLCPIGYLL
uniref:RNase H type-1 domain-containing protein n=1 Tax=Nelumbo nucifera TaxID=4432 RepID=A0A822YRT2_NELNU|nr:TPA_asm: hypothetical protein HUJ06_010769 [Nelumbo nucifera]